MIANNGLRRRLIGLVTLLLCVGVVPMSSADDLSDARDKVRKELVSASNQVKDNEKEVKRATVALQDSQDDLKQAQAKLTHLKGQLADAKAEHEQIKAELEKAKVAVSIAKEQVIAAGEEVDGQKLLITLAARSEYQRRSDLIGYGLVFSADSASEISNQLQWASTIFNTTAAELTRLEELETRLSITKDVLAKAEAEVAARNLAAKEQVAKIKSLTDDAAAQASRVQQLVAANQKAKEAAQDELEVSKKEYQKQQAKEAEIMRKIAEQAAKDKASGTTMTATGFVYPVNAKPGSPFGMRYHPILHYNRMHWGQDFGAPCGAPLFAMADGKVTSTLPTRSSNGLGNYTIISYGTYKGKSISSGYAHQSKIIVKVGQQVSQGQVVGYVGTTGLSTGCHLHLQIYYGGARVNPMQFL
ncbi:MAG: peptidoglycan DD-metalloendopeptidase family protein [Propionibacteriaceae bacterium]|jgi:murein DD-endopeptidase MepM/ murein hydrolase activator NlpD|nr:peptidoglycan DD-metalloendopeptidase family protein [Propionibacteriaceae bacterium]